MRASSSSPVLLPRLAVSAASSDTSPLETPPTRLSSSASPRSSPWISRYKENAKGEFLDQDISSLLRRFDELSAAARPSRKPLNTSLLAKYATSTPFAGLADDTQAPNETSTTLAGDDDGHSQHLRGSHGSVVMIPGQSAARLRRQATKLTIQHRKQTLSAAEQLKKQHLAAKIVPTRFLFDSTRWQRSTRCDYCQLAGGDLECATCDIIAHASCFLNAYESTARKTKGAFIVPTRFSWLCRHCQTSLQDEYDDRAKRARHDYIATQKAVFGKVVTAYVRMTRDALTFKKKKDAIIKIQAMLRGRLARARFNRLQRMKLKPYAVENIRVFGYRRHDGESGSQEELRLANGFACNPYVYVTVVEGDDDDSQLFCFETTVHRKGVVLASDADANIISWKNDRLFVPGVNGNVTLSFTVLSKNGPNNFMLGQAVVRLRDSDSLWRSGSSLELPLSQELEIFPRTAQKQPLRLADPSPITVVAMRKTLNRNAAVDPVFANGSSLGLSLSVLIQPFSDVHSHCGYLVTKNTLDSFQTSQRWCVLADGVLRIYRHYGVTLATDTIEMAHTIEIKLVETKNVNRQEQWIAMEHMTRLYIFQSERSRATTKQWLKKLQAAARFSSTLPSSPLSSPYTNDDT